MTGLLLGSSPMWPGAPNRAQSRPIRPTLARRSGLGSHWEHRARSEPNTNARVLAPDLHSLDGTVVGLILLGGSRPRRRADGGGRSAQPIIWPDIADCIGYHLPGILVPTYEFVYVYPPSQSRPRQHRSRVGATGRSALPPPHPAWYPAPDPQATQPL